MSLIASDAAYLKTEDSPVLGYNENRQLVGIEIDFFPLRYQEIVKKLNVINSDLQKLSFDVPDKNLKEASLVEILTCACDEYVVPLEDYIPKQNARYNSLFSVSEVYLKCPWSRMKITERFSTNPEKTGDGLRKIEKVS